MSLFCVLALILACSVSTEALSKTERTKLCSKSNGCKKTCCFLFSNYSPPLCSINNAIHTLYCPHWFTLHAGIWLNTFLNRSHGVSWHALFIHTTFEEISELIKVSSFFCAMPYCWIDPLKLHVSVIVAKGTVSCACCMHVTPLKNMTLM